MAMDQGLYVGLISGTSVDAVDAAAVDFDGDGVRIVGTRAHPVPETLRQDLLALGQGGSVDLDRLGELDTAVGRLFADAATTLLGTHDIDPGRVRAIGSHGQTLRHRPAARFPFTLQVGDPSTIAERTGITTVADFRRRDLAAGGEGAPLVPAFHAALLQTPGRARVVLNLGGIANITVLPGDPAEPVTGFDTGPANGLMDAWIARRLGEDFDRDGRWAASGRVVGELLEQLLGDPYFAAAPPKSTGREVFNLAWLERHLAGLRPQPAPEDIQATLLALTVESVARAIRDHSAGTRELLVCGGGARNASLLAVLAAALPELTVGTTEAFGLAPEWVEAAAFAWLARETLAGRPGNLPAVTGASHPVVLGGIYPGARWPPD
jgi:anhydro-N-acetylmuramic acid kinase